MYDPNHNSQFKLLDKFTDLYNMGKVWPECMIHAQPDSVPQSYDYSDHYRNKDKDVSQHRFCANTEASKNYEIMLKTHCSVLVPEISDFMWDVKVPKSRRRVQENI